MPDMTAASERYGWLPDELATAGRENLDADHVARYDAKEDAWVADEVALLGEQGLGEGWTVVDLGAGTGQFALAAAPVCERVVAVDVSEVMLERLRAKVDAGALSNIEVVRAGFLTYEHRGEAADLVYSRYALHHLHLNEVVSGERTTRPEHHSYRHDRASGEGQIVARGRGRGSTYRGGFMVGGWMREDLEGGVGATVRGGLRET